MSKIEWTDTTWNPTTGCSRVSPGCDNCYMFAMYPRLKQMGVTGYDHAPDQVALVPSRIDRPRQWKNPRRVFVNSMSDLFHHDISFEYIAWIFGVMRETPQHTYQVLTKRPGRAAAFKDDEMAKDTEWRWPQNVWIGTSVESQKYAPRIEPLRRIHATRFVSAEPLLEPLTLAEYMDALDWLIVGGESGPNARPMELDWVRVLRDEAHDAGVAFFLKQLGGVRNKRGGDKAVLDGETYHEFPIAVSLGRPASDS